MHSKALRDGAYVAPDDIDRAGDEMLPGNDIDPHAAGVSSEPASTPARTIISAATIGGAAGVALFGPAGAIGGAVIGIVGGAALAHSEKNRQTKSSV